MSSRNASKDHACAGEIQIEVESQTTNPTENYKLDSKLALGNKALAEKKYDQAIRYYQEALGGQPELAPLLNANIKLAEKRLGQRVGLLTGDEAVTVDIIVPVYNALDDVKLCLESLARNTDGIKVRVLVVNDGSDFETTTWVREYCRENSIFDLIEHSVNKGYTCAVNTGLSATTAEYVVTQNSDTIVPTGWLAGMVRCMQSDQRIGVVGPLSNAATWQNVPKLHDETGGFAVNEVPSNYSIESMAALVASVATRQYPRVPFVNGFCFMIRRSLLEKIGPMDDKTFPVGYGEENDFCIRAADAGYELAIAEDVYVFHAKSKSFGHERRRLLSEQGARNLRIKHGEKKYVQLVNTIKRIESLNIIRERITRAIERGQGSGDVDLMEIRVLFILPVKGGGGGAHSVVQEVMEMRRMDIHARIAVKKQHIEIFQQAYSDIVESRDAFVGFDEDSLIELSQNYDVVVATIYQSMELVRRIVEINPHILPAYYVQDYEPLFFTEGSSEWQAASASYNLVPGAFLFAKTQWIIEQVKREHDTPVHKVCPSIDHEVYKPRRRGVSTRFQIIAMIRPQTPRRGADRTMRLLAKLHNHLGNRISIHIFGCATEHPDFQKLKRDFPFVNHGQLARPQVASLLAQSDLFIDLSDYQAFGRTALEAMACGCAAVVPTAGGAHEYAIHEQNALLLDTSDEEGCYEAIAKLLQGKPEELHLMRRRGLRTAAQYSVHAAAVSEIVQMEAALKRWQTLHPRRVKRTLFLLPDRRDDGLPSDIGYARVLIPYSKPEVRRDWLVAPVNDLPQPGYGQVVLLQSSAANHSLPALRRWLANWKAAGGKILYDIYEDIIESKSPCAGRGLQDMDSLEEKVQLLATNADLVHVSNETLRKKFIPHNDRVYVIPNALDRELWRLSSARLRKDSRGHSLPQRRLIIGYLGKQTDSDFPEFFTEAIREISAKYNSNVEIEVVGAFQNRTPTFGKRVGFPKKTEYPDFVRWLQERVHWDIGIIPMPSEAFNEQSGYLKFLEYAALEMAIVVSGADTYSAVARHRENALVVEASTIAWVQAISELVENTELRNQLAASARKAVLEHHTLEKVSDLIQNSLSMLGYQGSKYAI